MHTIFLPLAEAVLTQGPTAASEKAAVMVPVHQFVDGFNKGDTKTAAAACADQTSMKETGSMFTFALQKGAAGWRITGWAWAKQ